jgi:hypothetical protein
VLIDNQQIGVTPLSRDLAAGSHTVTLMHGGKKVASKKIAVEGGEQLKVTLKAKEPEEAEPATHGSRVGPALLLVAGVGALGAGGVLLYYGHKGGPNDMYIYPDSTPIGIGVIAVGVGATIGGAILLGQSSHRSTPTVALGGHGGYVGWITRF